MRTIFVSLASWFPPRRIADRILPWVTLLIATFGAGWTLFQYSNGVTVQRVATTLSIHRQFLETYPSGAQAYSVIPDEGLAAVIFGVRCELYAEAVAQDAMPNMPSLPDCESVTLLDRALLDEVGAFAPQEVRDKIRERVDQLEIINAPEARRMMTFMRSLQVCVQSKQCAEDITTELFAGDMVAFLNASCGLAGSDPEFRRQGLMLGQFARGLLPDGVIPWNTDPNRKDLFFCSYLRIDPE